jgi:hypothetical protein
MAKKQSLSDTQKAGIGVGLTAAAVTAVGAYFLYGSKNAAKNRKKVKGWMLMARGEVLEALERAKTMTREDYEELVDSVAGAYSSIENATKSDISEFRREMKDHWKQIAACAAPKKAAKKAPKKAAQKKV